MSTDKTLKDHDLRIQNVVLKQQSIDQDTKHSKEQMDRIEKKIDDFIKSADARFSGKWVETGAKGAIGSVIGVLLFAVLGLIIN